MAVGDLTLHKTTDDDATVATTLAAIAAAGLTPVAMAWNGATLYILARQNT